MRLTRVHTDTPLHAGVSVRLAGSAAQHLRRVLRAEVGDQSLNDGHMTHREHRLRDVQCERTQTRSETTDEYDRTHAVALLPGRGGGAGGRHSGGGGAGDGGTSGCNGGRGTATDDAEAGELRGGIGLGDVVALRHDGDGEHHAQAQSQEGRLHGVVFPAQRKRRAARQILFLVHDFLDVAPDRAQVSAIHVGVHVKHRRHIVVVDDHRPIAAFHVDQIRQKLCVLGQRTRVAIGKRRACRTCPRGSDTRSRCATQ